ncbi:MAG: SDR family NAD(P)-dependent oxidoreductase [Parasphingopyxis sp.]|nr:SDR family oxidoreductase [Sphingomonadales bacterium]
MALLGSVDRKGEAMKVDGKKAVVTGGASGIGRAIAEALGQRGCRVFILDIDARGAERAAAAIGNRSEARACNVRDTDQLESLARECWAELGGVDLVFANAGAGPGAPLLKASADEFDYIYEVNLRGAWATCAAFGRLMVEECREGHLCITGSEHSLGMQHIGSGFYSASKAAILGLADVLRHELPDHIGVSLLCPGVTRTHFYDGGKKSGLPPPSPEAAAFAREILGRGMPAGEVAEIALKGVEQGAWIIPTHAASRKAAEIRAEEIARAFDRNAPPSEGAERYEVRKLIDEVRDEMRPIRNKTKAAKKARKR